MSEPKISLSTQPPISMVTNEVIQTTESVSSNLTQDSRIKMASSAVISKLPSSEDSGSSIEGRGSFIENLSEKVQKTQEKVNVTLINTGANQSSLSSVYPSNEDEDNLSDNDLSEFANDATSDPEDFSPIDKHSTEKPTWEDLPGHQQQKATTKTTSSTSSISTTSDKSSPLSPLSPTSPLSPPLPPPTSSPPPLSPLPSSPLSPLDSPPLSPPASSPPPASSLSSPSPLHVRTKLDPSKLVAAQGIANTKKASQQSSQSILNEIVTQLKTDTSDPKPTIKADLAEDGSGKFKLEPYTIDNKICYKVNVTYTVSSSAGNVTLERTIYTTATTPEEAKLAARNFTNIVVSLAAGDGSTISGTDSKKLQNQTSFTVRFNYGSNQLPTVAEISSQGVKSLPKVKDDEILDHPHAVSYDASFLKTIDKPTIQSHLEELSHNVTSKEKELEVLKQKYPGAKSIANSKQTEANANVDKFLDTKSGDKAELAPKDYRACSDARKSLVNLKIYKDEFGVESPNNIINKLKELKQEMEGRFKPSFWSFSARTPLLTNEDYKKRIDQANTIRTAFKDGTKTQLKEKPNRTEVKDELKKIDSCIYKMKEIQRAQTKQSEFEEIVRKEKEDSKNFLAASFSLNKDLKTLYEQQSTLLATATTTQKELGSGVYASVRDIKEVTVKQKLNVVKDMLKETDRVFPDGVPSSIGASSASGEIYKDVTVSDLHPGKKSTSSPELEEPLLKSKSAKKEVSKDDVSAVKPAVAPSSEASKVPKMTIRTVPGDGDCLFASFALGLNKTKNSVINSDDDLFAPDIFTVEKEKYRKEDLSEWVGDLRQKSYNFLSGRIEINKDENIKNQIKDAVIEHNKFSQRTLITGKGAPPKKLEDVNDEHVQEYLQKSRVGTDIWGATPQLLALSALFKAQVFIYERDASGTITNISNPIKIGKENSENNPITLVRQSGNTASAHYDYIDIE